MRGRTRQIVLGVVMCSLMLSMGGCALGKRKLVPESLATCRELSRDGVAAMELGEWDRARTLLADAVEASPTDVDARRSLAEALWQKGAYRDAIIHMETAVRLDPRHATTIVRSGEMLLGVGAVDRAGQRAQEAIKLDPTLAGAWVLRGRVSRQQGELELALADMHHALRYGPQQTDTLIEAAQIQYELGKPQRSLTTLHHLLETCAPGDEPQQALWLEGLAYRAVGRHLDAVESLQAASAKGQPQPELLYHLAQAEQSAGQRDEAAATLKRALILDARHEPSRVMLAQLEEAAAGSRTGTIWR